MDVPGIGTITGERFSNHANANCEGDASWSAAMRCSGPSGAASGPAASGNHRYYFHIYALDIGLDLRTGSPREALEAAMRGHVLAKGTLMAHYGRVAEHV